jgi:hypothetical protein
MLASAPRCEKREEPAGWGVHVECGVVRFFTPAIPSRHPPRRTTQNTKGTPEKSRNSKPSPLNNKARENPLHSNSRILSLLWVKPRKQESLPWQKRSSPQRILVCNPSQQRRLRKLRKKPLKRNQSRSTKRCLLYSSNTIHSSVHHTMFLLIPTLSTSP